AAQATGASLGFIGAGNYAGRVLMPAFKAAGARLHTVVSRGGVSASHFGRKYGFAHAATDVQSVLGNQDVAGVVIATRHADHARQVLAALEAGKHVFCEKPLCLTHDELEQIRSSASAHPESKLMV